MLFCSIPYLKDDLNQWKLALFSNLYFKELCYKFIQWCFLLENPLFGTVKLCHNKCYKITWTFLFWLFSLRLLMDKKGCTEPCFVTILSNLCLLRLGTCSNLMVTYLPITYVILDPIQLPLVKISRHLSLGAFLSLLLCYLFLFWN